MITKLLVAVLLLSLSACTPRPTPTPAAPAAEEAPRDGAFIHISHGTNDVHRVAMALQMAALMAEDRDVLVYFDIKGVEVVLKDAPDITYSHFPGSRAQLEALAARGVTLAACPGCLKAAGKSAADLADGITVADKEKFFGFTRGRILTLDY